MNLILKAIGVIVLLLLGLVGLGMSLCGGMVTYAGLMSSGQTGGEFRAGDFRIISIPSLLIGLLLVWRAVAGLLWLARGRQVRGTPQSDDHAA